MKKGKTAKIALKALREARGLTLEQAEKLTGYKSFDIERAESGSDESVWEWMEDYVTKLGFDIQVISNE